MRIVADLPTGDILQVEPTPDIGQEKPFNGRYVIPVPEGAALDVTSSSYVLPVDGNDVSSLAMAALLVQFPMYENILFNPLLTASDIGDLDLTATGPSSIITRAQVGRASGLQAGHAPNMVAVLPQNSGATVARPGCLVTDTIDITAYTGGIGADEFMVWWKIYTFETTDDVLSDYGATSGDDEPAVKYITEVDQEPSGWNVYVSNDDGATWTEATRMMPTDLGVFGTDVRVCFRNTSTTKRYLAAYAILF